MSDAILRFKLPEERREFDLAAKGERLNGLLFDLDQEMRNKLKYGKISKNTRDVLEALRTMVREEMAVIGVEL